MNTNITILLLRLDYFQEVINKINEIVYSEKSKEVCIKEINKQFKNINRASNDKFQTLLK